MKHILRLFIIGALVASCNPDSHTFNEVDIFKEFTSPVTLLPDKEYKIYMGNPADYLVMDSLLFVLELEQDRFIRCINLNTEQEIAFFLSKGRGPGELTHCLSLRHYKGDSIQVYGNPPSIMQFSIRDVLNGIEASDYRTSKIEGLFHVRPNALRISENMALFPGTPANQEGEDIFYLYDFKTAEYHGFGHYNPSFFRDMNLLPTQKSLVGQTFIEPHPDGNHFVSATVNYKSVEVYNLQSEKLIASRYYELPKVDIIEENGITFTFSSEEQKGFSSVYCTEKAIYCYYTKREDMRSEDINKPVYIFVYDWQLLPIKCYAIEAWHASGFVSVDDRYIYASKIDPETEEFTFCRYEM
jgi:hypothetical protein